MNVCRSPSNALEFEQYYVLRWEILRQPWGQPLGSERDTKEHECIHRMIIDDNYQMVAVGRLEQSSQFNGQIRFMAVRESAQGQGFGQQIMTALECEAKKLGITEITLNARENAEAFYQRLGYSSIALSHKLYGEIQHILMKKDLNKKRSNKVITSVGIIGCGWLGKALAFQLQDQGVEVLATRSNIDNVAQLKDQGIHTAVLTLPTEQATLNRHAIFKQHCLVIAITPQFRQGRVDYAEKIKQLVAAATINNVVEKIILLSSSAIYNGLSGYVDENIALQLSADKVSLLNEAEQTVLGFNQLGYDRKNNKANKAYVLRLSGLVGPNRHPGKFLLNDRMLKSPRDLVNLIHQQDAVGLILALLQSDLCGNIFNGVSSTHLSKKEYYQAAAKILQLPTPSFAEEKGGLENPPKLVSGEKALIKLNYSFVYDDLLKWLEQ